MPDSMVVSAFISCVRRLSPKQLRTNRRIIYTDLKVTVALLNGLRVVDLDDITWKQFSGADSAAAKAYLKKES